MDQTPFRALSYLQLAAQGSTVAKHPTAAMQIEAGLNAMDEQGFSLVSVLPSFLQADSSHREIRVAPIFIFRRTPGDAFAELPMH